jgi:hypothetical protein
MRHREIEVDHIDPTWKEGRDYQLICGLDSSCNLLERGYTSNVKKSNRFLPWRVCSEEIGVSPQNEGDLALFLVGFDIDNDVPGEWVLMEFLSDKWYEETKQVCGNSVGGKKRAESGGLAEAGLKGCQRGGQVAGKKVFEDKKGIFAPGAVTTEMLSAAGKRAAQVTKETGTGLYGVSLEVKSENGTKTMAFRYQDPDHPELGERSAPHLVQMQKRRGYPHAKENRVRVS